MQACDVQPQTCRKFQSLEGLTATPCNCLLSSLLLQLWPSPGRLNNSDDCNWICKQRNSNYVQRVSESAIKRFQDTRRAWSAMYISSSHSTEWTYIIDHNYHNCNMLEWLSTACRERKTYSRVCELAEVFQRRQPQRNCKTIIYAQKLKNDEKSNFGRILSCRTFGIWSHLCLKQTLQ